MDLIHKYAIGTIQVKKWKHSAILSTQIDNSKLTMRHGKFVQLKINFK